MILAGGGAVTDEARQRLAVLAQRSGSLLGTTLVAKDLFRGHESISARSAGSSDAAREVIRETDLLLAFGASLSSFTMGLHTLFRGIPIVHVDIDPAKLNANVPVAVGVVGDAAEVAGQLLDALPPMPAEGGDFRPAHGSRTAGGAAVRGDDLSTDTEIDPRVLALTLNEILPADATIVVDGGHHMAFSGAYVRVQDPAHFRTTTEFASVGMGFGAAIGAAVAAAGAPVILFIGDGGLLMTLGELETIERYRLAIAVVVMNDAAYGAERHFLDLDGLPHGTSQFPATEFAPIAAALGVRSATIRTVGDLHDCASFVREPGPSLLDCKIRPDVRANWIDELEEAREPPGAPVAAGLRCVAAEIPTTGGSHRKGADACIRLVARPEVASQTTSRLLFRCCHCCAGVSGGTRRSSALHPSMRRRDWGHASWCVRRMRGPYSAAQTQGRW